MMLKKIQEFFVHMSRFRHVSAAGRFYSHDNAINFGVE